MVRSDSLSHQRFDRLVEKALATLPEEFQRYLENVAVIIECRPSGEMEHIEDIK